MNQIRIIRQEEIDDALHELFSGKKKAETRLEPQPNQDYRREIITVRQPVSIRHTYKNEGSGEFSYLRAGLVLLLTAVGVGTAYLNSPVLREQIEHIWIEMMLSLKELVHIEPFVVLVGLAIILLIVGFVTKK